VQAARNQTDFEYFTRTRQSVPPRPQLPQVLGHELPEFQEPTAFLRLAPHDLRGREFVFGGLGK
jgi:hypothetical protein